MTFEDFFPFIRPSAPSCPIDTVLHHVRLASIDFCAKAPVWREDMDTLLADGFSSDYAMSLDDQTEIAKLLTVTVKDGGSTQACEARIVTSIEGRNAMRRGLNELIAWTDDRRSLSLWPMPKADAEIDVLVALKPSMAAFDFPDAVFNHHADDIAQGALARILRMPACDWTNPVLAQSFEDGFNARAAKAASQARQGFGRMTRTPQSRYF